MKEHQPECPSFFGRIFGHNYEDIYDTKSEEYFPNVGIKSATLACLDALKTKKTNSIFIQSVCKRCGHIINRPVHEKDIS